MLKQYFIAFFFFYSIHSDPINQPSKYSPIGFFYFGNYKFPLDCSVCGFGEYFNPSNGYGCFQRSINETICTCPDGGWISNQPCRICNRKGICGPPTADCVETSGSNSTVDKTYFGCFCSSTLFLIGRKCPEELVNITTVSPSSTTSVSSTDTTSTKKAATSNTQTSTTCGSSSHLFVEPILIVLLNLVYFFNK